MKEIELLNKTKTHYEHRLIEAIDQLITIRYNERIWENEIENCNKILKTIEKEIKNN